MRLLKGSKEKHSIGDLLIIIRQDMKRFLASSEAHSTFFQKAVLSVTNESLIAIQKHT